MKKLKAFVLDADAVQRKGEAGVRLYCKTFPKNAAQRFFAPFEPYFYLVPASAERIDEAAGQLREVKAFSRGKEFLPKRVEQEERILAGGKTTVLKIICRSPAHVPALREVARRWGETFEDNIPFTRRFLIDNQVVPGALAEIELEEDGVVAKKIVHITSGKGRAEAPRLNEMAFDIETHNPAGVPNARADPCIMISYATVRTPEAFAGHRGQREPASVENGGEENGVITYSKNSAAVAKKVQGVKVVEGEKQMIEEFCRLVREKKVDLLASYNGDEFDLPYLIERAKALKAELKLGRDSKPISVKKLGLRRRAKIGGRIHFDAFTPISFLNFIGSYRFTRLTLGAVYKELFGEEKLDTKKLEIWRAWDEGGDKLEHLLQYSKADAAACLKITRKILPLETELAKVTGLTLFEASRATPGQMVESLLMRHAFLRGEIVPQKPGFSTVQSRQEDAIKGAYVKMPSPGLYENIAVFDFRSLYPTIITSHNIDPFTLNCGCCKGIDNPNIAPTGDYFCTKKKGVIPETLAKVLEERFAIADEMKKLEKESGKNSEEYQQLDARKFALKILANSFYGYPV